MKTRTQDKEEKIEEPNKKRFEKITIIIFVFAYIILLFVSMLLLNFILHISIDVASEIKFNKELFEKTKLLIVASIALPILIKIIIVLDFISFLIDTYKKYNKERKN